jgi:two-component system phosphate regulon sensor histidine kinase PhoR
MVLTRTAEALSSDEKACRDIDTHIGESEIRKIDSLFKYYMDFYNFHISYSFEVIRPIPFKLNGLNTPKNVYNKRLEEAVSKNGLELILTFPDKKHFIMEEMDTIFVTSVLLILVVLVLFWRTTVSLMREKEISEHTTDFLNNMTHEFKTPLTNIALAGKMILKDQNIKQEEKVKHYSGIILEENEKLKLQVEQVLSMTALERGEIPFQKTELDIHQVIHDCLRHINIQIENKQGLVQLDLEADRFVVMGDRSHFINTLRNLLDNAIKYSKEKPELTIKTLNVGENLIITVSDKGIGIEKMYYEKIFDKFFRVPTGDVHNVKGFGLGLAYVKNIVELHCGAITLQSEKGEGTIFTITLPHV